MKITRTKEEIDAYIREVVSDADNFTSDNYGSESADNGIYEIYYSDSDAENTLRVFLRWLSN